MGISIGDSNNLVYCIDCARWYASNQTDQCDLPSGKVEIIESPVIGMKLRIKHSKYGHPSSLNKNNDCPHHLPISYFGKLVRKVFFNIPLKPTVVSKVR